MYYDANFDFFLCKKLSGVPMSDTDSAPVLAARRFLLASHFAGP
jgi:hypothetical protein